MIILDSNIIIYSSQPDYQSLRSFLFEQNPYCSRISYLETLGYHKITISEKIYLEDLLSAIEIIELHKSIIIEATTIRQKLNISTCDSIIAATALLYDLPLVTNNEKDFNKIKGLTIINPLKTKQN